MIKGHPWFRVAWKLGVTHPVKCWPLSPVPVTAGRHGDRFCHVLQPQYRARGICLGQSMLPFLDSRFFQAPWHFAARQSVEGEDSLKHAKKVCNNSSQTINPQSSWTIKNMSGFEQILLCIWSWGQCSPQAGLSPPCSPRAVEKLCSWSAGQFQGRRRFFNSWWGGSGRFSIGIQQPYTHFSCFLSLEALALPEELTTWAGGSWLRARWSRRQIGVSQAGIVSRQGRCGGGHGGESGSLQRVRWGHPLWGQLGPVTLNSVSTVLSKMLFLPAHSPQWGHGPRCFGTSGFYLYNRNSA